MNMEKLREKAIKGYPKGRSPNKIYQILGKGKPSFLNGSRGTNLINLTELINNP